MIKTVDLAILSGSGSPLASWLLDLLARVLREPAGVLSVVSRCDSSLDDWWYEERASWREPERCLDRRRITAASGEWFRALAAVVANHFMDQQFWGGESLRSVVHEGRRRTLEFVMSNDPTSGFWLRVYVDVAQVQNQRSEPRDLSLGSCR